MGSDCRRKRPSRTGDVGLESVLLVALVLLAAGAVAWFVLGRREETPVARRERSGRSVQRGIYPYPEARSIVHGRVEFAGTPPEPQPPTLAVRGDPVCEHAHAAPPRNLTVEVSPSGGVANAIAYLANPELEDYEYPRESGRTVVIDQKGCLYRPHVACLMAGQTLRFDNSDNTTHNVHLHSPAGTSGEWNLAQNPGHPIVLHPDRANYYPAQKEIALEATCDKHPWMSARIGVLFHPFFAVTDPEGRFELPPLLAGKYDLVVWHEVFGERRRSIEISESGAIEVDIEYANSEN